MFEGFEQAIIDVGDAKLNVKIGGKGPALLLLHGFPQTHVHWHAIAPLLEPHFTLVIPDLRGYGESIGPGRDSEHHNYSKRTMARDMVYLMTNLGHECFRLAGHDRGARVAYRLTLDYSDRVSHLASIDTIPTLDTWELMNMELAISAFHWAFLAQPAPIPERLIGKDPDFFLNHLLNRWSGSPDALDKSAVAQYAEHFRKPSVLEAMAEDYRAGATIDLEHDRDDRKVGNRISCPVIVPWGLRYTGESPLPIWKSWASDVREVCLDCGHFVAEEEPESCAAALIEFFK